MKLIIQRAFMSQNSWVQVTETSIQIHLITAIKRKGRGTNYCLWPTTLHISKFTLVGCTEVQNVFSRPTCTLEASELKGKKRNVSAHDNWNNRHGTKSHFTGSRG